LSPSEASGLICDKGGRAKLEAFLESWLQDSQVNVDVVISVQEDREWHPPQSFPRSPGKSVVVPVRLGVADTRQLHAAKLALDSDLAETQGKDDELIRSWCVDEEIHELRLFDLIASLMSKHAAPKILKQVIWYVGTALDLQTAYLHWPGRRTFLHADESGVHALAEPQGDDSKRGEKRKASPGDTWRDRDERLCEYWLAGRQFWHGGARQLSMAFDLSRAGGKNCGVMLLCTPGNVAHWMPPQVVREVHLGIRGTRSDP